MESQNYQKMLSEVESIIETIGRDDCDLDAMVTKVERGYTLIKAMRDRLDDAKGRIEKLQTQNTDSAKN